MSENTTDTPTLANALADRCEGCGGKIISTLCSCGTPHPSFTAPAKSPTPITTDTPITDAFAKSLNDAKVPEARCFPHWMSHGKNQERQLTEAQTKIERQAERIRYLEGATNHATGTPLSRMKKERDDLERQLAEAREQRDRLAEALRQLYEHVGDMTPEAYGVIESALASATNSQHDGLGEANDKQ